MTAEPDDSPADFSALQGRAMDTDGIEQLLRERGIGVLSLAADGTPYGIPMSFGYDSEDGDHRLYTLFAGHSEDGRKVRYAEQSEVASFLTFDVDSDGGWRSVIVNGAFERITPDDWETAREAMADNAYRPQLLTNTNVQEDPRVWMLDIEEMAGRAIGQA
ncbi:pyridoxamine 5'-phosphate oxidase family protein [Halovenus amylolytica]|uniref:pyridoxamine 5'-phosphate oxidase family protein n=1 Tax=Halovenus amylolytica TaxID=2500550 RepID=UPI00360AC81D